MAPLWPGGLPLALRLSEGSGSAALCPLNKILIVAIDAGADHCEAQLLNYSIRGVVRRRNLNQNLVCACFECPVEEHLKGLGRRASALLRRGHAVADLDPTVLWGGLEPTATDDSIVVVVDDEVRCRPGLRVARGGKYQRS